VAAVDQGLENGEEAFGIIGVGCLWWAQKSALSSQKH
jgi:hypothetical protein